MGAVTERRSREDAAATYAVNLKLDFRVVNDGNCLQPALPYSRIECMLQGRGFSSGRIITQPGWISSLAPHYTRR